MSVDFREVELGFVVSLGVLRDVLRDLNSNGRRWWVASDPQDAEETGFVTVGHGDPKCTDRLNTLYYRLPVVGNEEWKNRADRLILLLEPSAVLAEDPGYYLEDGHLLQDPVHDLFCFYQPIERALTTRLQAGN
jgi:hypothetical protein